MATTYTAGGKQIQKFLYTWPGMIAVFFHQEKPTKTSLTVRTKGGLHATDFLAQYVYLWPSVTQALWLRLWLG